MYVPSLLDIVPMNLEKGQDVRRSVVVIAMKCEVVGYMKQEFYKTKLRHASTLITYTK